VQIEKNMVYQGDCLDILQHVSDRSIDFIICDPPFGITAPKWDQHIDMQKLWIQYKRIIKDSGTIAMFGSQPFTTKLIVSNIKNFKYCWYWVKNQGTNFFHAKRMPIRKIEEICIFLSGKYNPQISEGHVPTQAAKGCSDGKAYHGKNKRNYEGGKTTRYPTNVLEFDCVNNYARLHSSQKPVELFEYLIKTYSDEQETVLDNCAGSGTTAIACINTNRNYILIEKEETYCEMIKQRINAHKKKYKKEKK